MDIDMEINNSIVCLDKEYIYHHSNNRDTFIPVICAPSSSDRLTKIQIILCTAQAQTLSRQQQQSLVVKPCTILST